MLANSSAKTALAVYVLAGGFAFVQAGPNLIQKGDFEQGASPTYPGVGLHWETNDAAAHPEIEALSASSHGGAYSQWLKAHPTWDLGAVRQVSGYNSVTAGRTYHVQAWIKTANVQNPAGWYVFGLWWFNGNERIAGSESESKMPRQETNNYSWRAVSWEVVAPAGANRVAAFLSRHTDGDAWYDDIFIGEVLAGAPVVLTSPLSFTHRIIRNSSLSDDVLSIHNTGGGLLNYQVTADAAWLTVKGASGTNAGEPDVCPVAYNLSSLGVGRHRASLTISDANGAMPPQTVPVQLTIYQPGDFDFDVDVDMSDFGHLQTCYSGQGIAQLNPDCSDARLDADEDIDQDDFERFLGCFTAPNVWAEPDCMLP